MKITEPQKNVLIAVIKNIFCIALPFIFLGIFLLIIRQKLSAYHHFSSDEYDSLLSQRP